MIKAKLTKNCPYIVFTDLDGTLLTHDTYSFEPARTALSCLEKKRIPLLICTSKTRSEIEKIRNQLQNTHPFISENGGAVFIPKDYFRFRFSFAKENSDYFIIEIGTPYSEIRKVLKKTSQLFPNKIRGFADLSSQEVANLCGLSQDQAKLAKQREYDEPFLLEEEFLLDKIRKIAKESNLQITRGGRFFHMTGPNDKGKAVLILKELYKREKEFVKIISLGDSQNDLPMLRVSDYPVLVQKPNRSYDPAIQIDHLMYADGVGPVGWNKAIIDLLSRLKPSS
jgi:mannosyl-3-phosphoglycerate phosphatase